MVALGKVVFTSREHIIAIRARGKGMMGITLRYPYEVRKEEDYFDVIEDVRVPKDMLDLAMHIVETKKGKFQPEKFEDRYEDALQDLIKKKQKGERIETPKERAPSNVVNLMDALRASVKGGGAASAERRGQKAIFWSQLLGKGLLLPGPQQTARVNNLRYMVGVVIRHQQRLA